MIDIDRTMRGMTLVWGIWAPRAAFVIGGLWWLSDYAPAVAALGFVVVPAVRIGVDRPLLAPFLTAPEALVAVARD